jgi:YHS domain-containing protein
MRKKTKLYAKKLYAVFLITLLTSQIAWSQERIIGEEGSVLFNGYDPVAYWSGTVSEGEETIYTYYEDRFIYFSNESNRQKFVDNPELFMPRYGGWCAISMVQNRLVEPDYTDYKVEDGSLLFFAVKAFFNGKTAWNKDSEYNRVLADANYNSLFAVNP